MHLKINSFVTTYIVLLQFVCVLIQSKIKTWSNKQQYKSVDLQF